MVTIYVDNNATTQVDPEVVEVMLPYLSEHYGNPSSMHMFGGDVGKAIEKDLSDLGEVNVSLVDDPVFAGAIGGLKLANDMPAEEWENL